MISQQQSRQGRRTACTSCRENKLRCLYALPDSEDQDPCHRCVRLAIPCRYQPKRKRGPQNGGAHEPGESEVSSRTRSRPEPYTRPERYSGTRERAANPEIECGYVSEPADFVGEQDNVEDSEAGQPRNEPGSTSSSTATILPGTYPMAFLSMLDLMESDVRRSIPLPSSDHPPQAGSSGRNRSPIGIEPSTSNATRARHESMEDSLNDTIRSVLSPEHETYLFERFFEKMNAYIAILDPELHTIDYCRRTSVDLFLAIITAASQVYMPRLYEALLNLFKPRLGEALVEGHSSIGLVQAISILCVWKAPRDHGSWLRVGYAIRMAYELGLDMPNARPLPLDQHAAREILNKERTFRQLACFDRTMSHLHGRTRRMIDAQVLDSIDQWLCDHPTVYCYADTMLAASFPHGEALIDLLNGSQKSFDVATRLLVIRNMEIQTDRWEERWFGNEPPKPMHPTSKAIVGFYHLAARMDIAEWRLRSSDQEDHVAALAQAIGQGIKGLNYVVDVLGPAEVLLFAPDFITYKASKMAVLLTRLGEQMDSQLLENVERLFSSVSTTCFRFSHSENIPHFQARFFDRLAHIVRGVWNRLVSEPEETPVLERPAISDQTALNVNIPEFDWSDPGALTRLLEQSQEWSVQVSCGSRAQKV
ncbi:hypothetical protein FFLO_01796 [Filobasidium floriforme]|uniref:Zn(2)-C6 fungal-type domain-containing protein n=1 Tax=Filobasidium floriforme TaxID=5210 RepID=A0A8K0JQP8_9TREE|nr:uncharacterized protein HD553DRAFT_25728 [Filobasidium floriforme]KAG7562735.1 hypothetical protein FFLO_01796 [Filobasidium floriforme]KAH8085285.1 hypothetical protein HD553DRAFT_25728 [Filobasidium floriforme]